MRLLVEPYELIVGVTVSAKLVYTRNLCLSLITQFVYPILLNRLQKLFHPVQRCVHGRSKNVKYRKISKVMLEDQ